MGGCAPLRGGGGAADLARGGGLPGAGGGGWLTRGGGGGACALFLPPIAGGGAGWGLPPRPAKALGASPGGGVPGRTGGSGGGKRGRRPLCRGSSLGGPAVATLPAPVSDARAALPFVAAAG